MIGKPWGRFITALGAALITVGAELRAANIGTAFTYQGFLESGAPPAPVSDACDFRFGLWKDPSSVMPADQVGSLQTPSGLSVEAGAFIATLDFGTNAIDGSARWLEIEVCCPSPCAPDGLVTLLPRVELKPAPHALALPGVYSIQESASTAGPITPPPKLVVRLAEGVASTVSLEAQIAEGAVGLQLKSGTDSVMSYDPAVQEAVFQAPSGVRAGSVKIDSSLASNIAGPGSTAELVVSGDILELRVDGNTVDRWSALGPSTFGLTPNRIGGSPVNNVAPGVFGATIGGGGASDFPNSVEDIFGTIAGGRANTAGFDAFVGGGNGNTAAGGSTIGGGILNETTEFAATIAGGRNNIASDIYSTIGGGAYNFAAAFRSTVSGGVDNQANGDDSTVGGGNLNIANSYNSTICGGSLNDAIANGATIGGGYDNTASGADSTIGGGNSNTSAGTLSTVPGGTANAAGGDNSFAAGRRAKVRTAAQSGDADGDNGTFVWADSTDADFTSTADNQFLIRASGGVGIGTTIPTARLHVDTGGGTTQSLKCEHVGSNLIVRPLSSGGDSTVVENTGGGSLVINPLGGRVGIGRTPAANNLEVEGEASKTSAGDWLANSDAAIKTQVRSVTDALSTIARLRPVAFRYTDDYKAKHPSVKDQDYYNYIAQEFGQVFPDWVQDSGEDGLLQMDAYPASVYAVAAIQELHQIVQEKDCEIEELSDRNNELEARLARLEALWENREHTNAASPVVGDGASHHETRKEGKP